MLSSTAIVVGAGAASRAGFDKVFVALADKPVLAHSVDVLQQNGAIDAIVLVLSPARLTEAERLIQQRGWSKVVTVCAGGARRQDSVLAGLMAAPASHLVLIHDAARPFLSPAMIQQGLAAAAKHGAAVAGVPLVDTVKAVAANGRVLDTPARDGLRAIQTPQVFRRELLLAAYAAASNLEFTDDAAVVEHFGHPVYVFPGEPNNLKLTLPTDLQMAEALLEGTCHE